MKNLTLGDRMKQYYENVTKTKLPRRTNTIIRIDGKAFHTYTRGLDKPFDMNLTMDMLETTKYLCENIQGCKMGYTQSDEISLWLTDYDTLTTSAWFDGSVQKIVSIASSMATAKFNELRPGKLAMFDARVFTINEIEEVVNYFVFRQQDATRNSVSMAAQANFSHKDLQGKSGSDMQDMLMSKGINWNDYPVYSKRGGTVVKREFAEDIKPIEAYPVVDGAGDIFGVSYRSQGVIRPKWTIEEPPIFTKDRDYIKNIKPEM
jgi:tRNA(His) 5'-end guanylyltransferase